MNGRVIAGFPAVGKSYVAARHPNVIDSDSSAYSKDDGWPDRYIEHLRVAVDEGVTVLTSTHAEVRAALVEAGIPFTLVYPGVSLRDEYIRRMDARGTPKLGDLVALHWDRWIADCGQQEGCERVVLGPGEYLSDAPLWGPSERPQAGHGGDSAAARM